MVSGNYVKVGRLVRILRGPRQDQVAVITDIIDATRILVENPENDKMWRHVQSLKNVEPLKFSVGITRGAKSAAVKEALTKANALAKYSKTRKAIRIAATHALENSTDFERYQLRVAKRSLAHHTRKIFDEKNKKEGLTWNQKLAKKLERAQKKLVDKKMKARHARIKQFFTKRKAKKASKGKGKKAKK